MRSICILNIIILLRFRESELSNKGSWQITHELVYQWLGSLATPFWWSDAHINNALARYITTYTTLKVIFEFKIIVTIKKFCLD